MDNSKLVLPKNESEIISSWEFQDKVYITCICITFNQSKYIEDALISMLAQKTSYRFEILIHDDCSTDTTKDILLEYRLRFPKIIRLILQEENQYSKGKKITPIVVPYALGSYIAFCEGDDYWCSDDKLQKQFLALEKNSSIDLCVHDAFCMDRKGIRSKYSFPIQNYSEGIIPFSAFSDVYTQFSPTASMFCRVGALKDACDKLLDAPCGDIFLEIFLGAGKGYYNVAGKKSVYNLGTIGSYAEKNKNSIKSSILFKESVIFHLREVVKDLENSDREVVLNKILKLEKNMLLFKSQLNFLESIKILPIWARNIFFFKKLSKEDLKIAISILGYRSKYFK